MKELCLAVGLEGLYMLMLPALTRRGHWMLRRDFLKLQIEITVEPVVLLDLFLSYPADLTRAMAPWRGLN